MRGLWMSTLLVGCLMCVCFPLSVLSAFNGPVDTSVNETADALLTCSSQSGANITNAAWSDEYGIFASGETLIKTAGKYSNFELVADYANGQYNLRIDNAEYEDQGTYFCQIGNETEKEAMLTVEAEVTNVTITVNGTSGSSFDVMAGEEQTLVCTAVGARPRVGIDWTNDGVSISGDNETKSINGDTIDTTSTLPYTPTRNDNCHQFQCVTTGQQAATPQSQSVTLNVLFAPADVVVEYSRGTINCSSIANPTVANNQYVITIILNETESTGNTTQFNPETNGNCCRTVKCTATNAIGTGTGFLAEPLCPGQVPNPAVIASGVVILIVIIIIIVCIAICYKKKKICFVVKSGSGGKIPKKKSTINADMIQTEVRPKYDDDPKKPRIPRNSSTGNSKKQPWNDDYSDGRNQESGGQGGVTYADLEFQNRQGDTNVQGKIHNPEEEPTKKKEAKTV